MASLKHFWLWFTTFVLLALIVLVVTVWRTSPSVRQNVQPSNVIIPDDKNLQQPTISASEPDPSLPAPAKKLHKVINDPEYKPNAQSDLQEKTERLDKQLDILNKQLQEQGIAIPEPKIEGEKSSNETAERLEKIKNYIKDKN